jgi:hypothetical protein
MQRVRQTPDRVCHDAVRVSEPIDDQVDFAAAVLPDEEPA